LLGSTKLTIATPPIFGYDLIGQSLSRATNIIHDTTEVVVPHKVVVVVYKSREELTFTFHNN